MKGSIYMEKIKVILSYPLENNGDEKPDKNLELSQLELLGILNCDKIGSEGQYYEPEYKIFEDTDDTYLLYIRLKHTKI